MTDRPILFSGPMVRAILEGRKTQTRRLISTKPRGHLGGVNLFDGTWTDDYVLDPGNVEWRQQIVRYAVGDRLWVRETWSERLEGEAAIYRADAELPIVWRPSIFMPRWASRLTLTVTDVRVQRLQEISRDDVIAEGITEREGEPIAAVVAGWHEPYAALWDSLNAKRAPWASNPWVVAVTFTVERNA